MMSVAVDVSHSVLFAYNVERSGEHTTAGIVVIRDQTKYERTMTSKHPIDNHPLR